jgi:hypothetical protein
MPLLSRGAERAVTMVLVNRDEELAKKLEELEQNIASLKSMFGGNKVEVSMQKTKWVAHRHFFET